MEIFWLAALVIRQLGYGARKMNNGFAKQFLTMHTRKQFEVYRGLLMGDTLLLFLLMPLHLFGENEKLMQKVQLIIWSPTYFGSKELEFDCIATLEGHEYEVKSASWDSSGSL